MKKRNVAGSWSRLMLIGALFTGAAHGDFVWVSGGLENFQSSTQFGNTLNTMAMQEKKIDEIGVTPNGEWVVVAGTQVVASAGFPAQPLSKIQTYIAAGKTIDVVAFAPGGGWVVIAENLHWRSMGLPRPLLLGQEIEARIAEGRRIQEIAFAPDGEGWTIVADNYMRSESMPQELVDAVQDNEASKRRIQGISVAPNGSWVLYADQWTAIKSAPTGLASVLRNRQMNRDRIAHVRLAPNGGFVVYTHGTIAQMASNHPLTAIRNLENQFLNSGKSIWKRMDELKVRGASIAVVQNNEVQVARGYGLREWGTENPVLSSTPFDAASLTKFITASTAMRMIGSDYIRLASDLLVKASEPDPSSQLSLWKIYAQIMPATFGLQPGVSLPAGMTLRRLLSHTASATDVGPVGLLESEYPNTVPHLWQRLLGFNCNAAGCFWDQTNYAWWDPAQGSPGTNAQYTNAGYMLAQGLIENMGGNVAFHTLVKNHVLNPLGMTNSEIVYKPMSAAWENKAAKMHDGNGNKLERRIYLWSGSGGLYTTAGDYAKAMIPLLKQGKTESDASYLNPYAVHLMLQNNPPQNFYGLGLGLSVPQVTSTNGFFRHSGSHPNRARALMTGCPDKQLGLVVLVNGGHDGAATFVDEVQTAFRNWFGWDGC